MPQEVTTEQIFTVLSDHTSLNLMKTAYAGRLTSSNYVGKLSKKQFYTKLKRLCNTGLVEKREDAYYRTTTLGSHVSKKMFEKIEKGVSVHFLDGNPRQISVESRLNAILRTPPNDETFRNVNRLIRSNRFELKTLEPSTLVSNGNSSVVQKFNSFLVIDGNQVLYENINYGNPEEFSVAIARYDDTYLAEQFINYWKLLSKDAVVPKLLETVRART